MPAPPPDPAVLRELRTIPGVGPSISMDLWNIGVRSVGELAAEDPKALYDRICAFQGLEVDRCLLYVMRCAVYFAREPDPDPELLRWWAWKDRPGPGP